MRVFNVLLLNNGIMPPWRSILSLIPEVERHAERFADAGLSIEGVTAPAESGADLLSFDLAFDGQMRAILDDLSKASHAALMALFAFTAESET